MQDAPVGNAFPTLQQSVGKYLPLGQDVATLSFVITRTLTYHSVPQTVPKRRTDFEFAVWKLFEICTPL